MSVRHTVTDSPIGELTIVGDAGVLTDLHFAEPRRRPPEIGVRADTEFTEVIAQLAEYFAGDRTEFELELAPRGPDFDKRVWQRLRTIPYGQTRGYGDLATDLGAPGAAQAVGAANGRNPLPILLPCHRVIGADGSLTGYAGGLDRKRFLLDLEEPASVRAQRLF